MKYMGIKSADKHRARKFSTTWYRQEEAGSQKLVLATAEDGVQKGWLEAKYKRAELRWIRVDQDMRVVSMVPLVHGVAPVPDKAPLIADCNNDDRGDRQQQSKFSEFTGEIKGQVVIPPSGDDMSDHGNNSEVVDCGDYGYVSMPVPGVVYKFPVGNCNFDFVGNVRLKATTHTKNKRKNQCGGCTKCRNCVYKLKPATTPEQIRKQLKEKTCQNCHGKMTLEHIDCQQFTIRTTLQDGSHTLESVGTHSEHPSPPNLRPPSSVLAHECVTNLPSGTGPMSNAVRSGRPVTQFDVAKANRWQKEAERRLHPGGTGLEACADFNEMVQDEYILGDVAVEGFSCATKWQRSVVEDIVRELHDDSIPDEKRSWDGWSYNDLTYSMCDKMFMQTMAFYNFNWGITVPVMTTWLRGLSALHYARHFDNFFKYNACVLTFVLALLTFQLMGFCMDFSDAQFIGLGLAYGKAYLRRVQHDERPDTDPTFIKDARAIGDKFIEKYCKGCEFHFAQSIRKVSFHVTDNEEHRAKFMKLAQDWVDAPLESSSGVSSAKQILERLEKKFPKAANWLKWWKKRAHLFVKSTMSLVKPADIMKSYPSTDNNMEAHHATVYRLVPRKELPIYLALNSTYCIAKNAEAHALAIMNGTRKPARKRGKQHTKSKVPKDLQLDEWTAPRADSARAMRKLNM